MIQSVERALTILEILSRNRVPLSVIEIANELEVNRTTVHGLLNTLMEMDYVVNADIAGKYVISGKMYNLSFSYPNNLEVVRFAMPYLQEMVDMFGVTAHLGTLSIKNNILLLKAVFPKNMADITSGSLFPLHATGLGKVTLAFQQEDKQKELIESIEFKSYTANTITEKEALYKDLKAIRENKYAYDLEEFIEDTCCIAFPLFNEKDEIVAAFSISGLKNTMEPAFQDIVSSGLRHSKLCSKDMGCTLFN